jgi:hypothetical protein
MTRKYQSEIILCRGNAGLLAATPRVFDPVDLYDAEKACINIISEQAGTYLVECYIDGQWINLWSGTYSALTPKMLILTIAPQLPHKIRLTVTPTVAGKLLASVGVYPWRDITDAIDDTDTLGWVTGLADVEYELIGPAFATTEVSQADPTKLKNEPYCLTKSRYVPTPDDEDSSSYSPFRVDIDGNLISRSQVLTDEGSFGDDFIGASLITTLANVTFVNGSTAVVGIGSSFLTTVSKDRYIKRSSHSETCYAKVKEVIDNTNLILETAYTGANSSGAADLSYWVTSTSAHGAMAVANSQLTITQPTDNGEGNYVYRSLDYQPLFTYKRLSISQRVANQILDIGVVDNYSAPTKGAAFRFDGTDNTLVKCRSFTSTAAADTLETTVKIPKGGISSDQHIYERRLFSDKCAFYIDDVEVAIHKYHLPSPYVGMFETLGIVNAAIIGLATSVVVDEVHVDNVNRFDASVSQFVFDKLKASVRLKEDIIPSVCGVPVKALDDGAGGFVTSTNWQLLDAGTDLLPDTKYEIFVELGVITDQGLFMIRTCTSTEQTALLAEVTPAYTNGRIIPGNVQIPYSVSIEEPVSRLRLAIRWLQGAPNGFKAFINKVSSY